MGVALVGVIADELLLALVDIHPVAILHSGGIAGTGFLLGHLVVEAFLVNGEAILAKDKLGEVEREAIGIEESEGLLALQNGLASSFHLVHVDAEELDALVQGTEEAVFLLLHHTCDKLLLSLELRISATHLVNKDRYKFVHEGLLLVEEGIGIAHSAAQDTADDIAGLGIAGQLAVGNGKSHSAQVVGNDTDGDIHLLLVVDTLAILALRESVVVFMPGQTFNLLDDG